MKDDVRRLLGGKHFGNAVGRLRVMEVALRISGKGGSFGADKSESC
jgi:hypothetical protein